MQYKAFRLERSFPSLAEPPPLALIARLRSYPWLVVGCICIGAFMGQLDASITQLLLPSLQGTFHVSLAAVSWVTLVYLVVLAATLPIFGRLADVMGRKLLYTAGFVIFIAGSAACGFAKDLPVLIGARILQAIGAALLQANSVAIVTTAVGPHRRGRAIGMQGAAQAIGLSTGPALGGFLIQTIGWRWAFWINLPSGLLGALAAWLILPRTEHQHRPGRRAKRGFDWAGALLIAPALTLLLLALSEGPQWGGTRVAGIAFGGLAFLVAFFLRERAAAEPLVDLALFRSTPFSAGNAAGLLAYALLFGVFLLVPFALERGYGETPLHAGFVLSAIPLTIALSAPTSGAISDRIGPRAPTVLGMLIAAAALTALALTLGARSGGLAAVTIALAAFGLGQGLFIAPNNSAIMGAAPHHRLGAAGGILNVTRSLGTSLGVAFASALLTWRLAAGSDLVDAARAVLWTFVALALLAASLSATRRR